MKRREFLKEAGVATSVSAMLAGCSSDQSEQDQGSVDQDDSYSGMTANDNVKADNGELEVVYDSDGRMVCYVHRDGIGDTGTGGLDCEPISNTAYTESDFK